MSNTELTDTPFDPWRDFSTLTAARIALGRAGGSPPTRELLDFGLAHARARDAVWSPFDQGPLVSELEEAGIPLVLLNSAVSSRDQYLRRPDLGRRLSESSREELKRLASQQPACDLSMIISDGLSPQATRHAVPIVLALRSQLLREGWTISPVAVVRFGRVAVQDEIGQRLGATLSLILLGERPGLGSPDSLGAYLVHHPEVGRTDADRNCVSNIRPEGLPIAQAIDALHFLLTQSRHRKLSGVQLKDERLLQSPPLSLPLE